MPRLQPLTIVIMAKAPSPGHAKTRLIPALGAEGAAQLARRLLAHTLAAARAADLGRVEVCVTPSLDSPAWGSTPWPPGLGFSDQGEGDLGERMARVSERVLSHSEGVILIGTDCPQIGPELLRRAAEQLASADGVIYPARDGGYALLGLRRFSPRLFEDIPWSTDAVFRLTRERFDQLGWSLVLGETLQDIDEPADLRHLDQWPGWADEGLGDQGV